MPEFYPANPVALPPDLTRPSSAYTRHTWAAVAALLAFAALYVGLAVWLGHTTWRFLYGALHGMGPVGYLLAIPALFLLAFLVKGVFFVRRGQRDDAAEIPAATEPALFAFLHRIADEAGAARPHRVFLTADVNASVAYDISIRNLVWPTKKNLYVGLGLVNVLTLDEFKAVLAHEFGHFAQRTMAVGTWVYVARQAVAGIVARRDGFDTFLSGLSRIDLRIAWIGWIMRLLVWAIRAVLDTAFRGVVVLERGLSQEMELQADLVSVSLAGSDSLIHALKRLPAADLALDRAIAFAGTEGHAGRPVADLYTIQERCLAGLRAMWNDPGLGGVPPRPADDAPAHRVFDHSIAEAPRMWASHPPSRDREENAKRRYVASVLDPRPTWALFADPGVTRREMTARLYRQNMKEATTHPVAPEAASIERLAERFSSPAWEPRYRGVHVGRSIVRNAVAPAALYDPVLPGESAAITAALDALYPETLVERLAALRDAEGQLAQLEALHAGVLEAPGGIIRWRGREAPRGEVGRLVAEAMAERDTLRAAMAAHDRAARSAHRAAARAVGGGWEEHLVGVVALVHYFENLDAEIADYDSALSDLFRQVTADSNVSSEELDGLVHAADCVHTIVGRVYRQAGELTLPAPMSERLEGKSWKDALGEEFALVTPTRERLTGNYLPALGTWVGSARRCLQAAAHAGVEALLAGEDHVARSFRAGTEPGAAPGPGRVPSSYPTVLVGAERKPKVQLGWWDRFQLAEGWGAGTARLGVATVVLAPAFVLTEVSGSGTVVVHNGLAVAVDVDVGDTRVHVPPESDARVNVSRQDDLIVAAWLTDGTPIETLVEDVSSIWKPYVYNVAGADVLRLAHVAYGSVRVPDDEFLGAPRWLESPAAYTFETPPSSIESSGPESRSILTGLVVSGPTIAAGRCREEDALSLVTAHARLDPVDAANLDVWIRLVGALGGDPQAIVRERSAAHPGSIVLGRLEQELGVDGACDRHAARAAERPDDGDARYLAARCVSAAGDTTAFAAAATAFPDHPWIAWAQARHEIEAGEWDAALRHIHVTGANVPMLRDQVEDVRLMALRMLGAPLPEQVAALADGSEREWRARLLRAEATGKIDEATTAITTPAELSILSMAAGNLPAAWGPVPQLGDQAAFATRMIAASDGATPEQVAAALALPPAEGIGPWSLVPTLALVAREGGNVGAILAAAVAETDRAPFVALDAASTEAELAAAIESTYPHSPFLTRGNLRLYGVVRLGAQAPAEWRREAKALVLPWARPWLR